MKARYRVTFDESARRWAVWDGHAAGIDPISLHHSNNEARAAARRYDAADKRRARQAAP